MTRCMICYDEGTTENPLIHPCLQCALETHKECILDIISTSLLAQRINYMCLGLHYEKLDFYDRFTLYLDKRRRVFSPLSQVGEILSDDYNYRRLILRGGICNAPSSYPNSRLNKITFLYLSEGAESKKSEVYVTDECVHCKRLLKFSAETNESQILEKILGPVYFKTLDTMVAKVKLFIGQTRLRYQSLYLPPIFTSFMKETLRYVSIIPWLMLGRKIPEYRELMKNPDPFTILHISNNLMVLGSERISYSSLSTYITTIVNLILNRKSLPFWFGSSIILVRMISDFVFTITLGFKYTELMLDNRPLDCLRIMKDRPALREIPFQNWSFKDKFVITHEFLYDFSFKPTDYIEIDESVNAYNADGYIVDYRNCEVPFYHSSKDDEKNVFSLPFKSFALIIFGPIIGHAIIGKCKPLVGSIYKLLKRFNPKPVEVEMVLEYLGYQSVLLFNQVYQFVSFYYETKSIQTFASFVGLSFE